MLFFYMRLGVLTCEKTIPPCYGSIQTVPTKLREKKISEFYLVDLTGKLD